MSKKNEKKSLSFLEVQDGFLSNLMTLRQLSSNLQR